MRLQYRQFNTPTSDYKYAFTCFRVWQDWIVENDTFVGLNFVMGEECGAVDREAKVGKLGQMILLHI